MNHKHLNIIALALVMFALVFWLGCKTAVRENILTSINTGFGVAVVENPQTQLYEVKVGYIRSQHYSIPTGKRVAGDSQGNDAHITPELVSGIHVGTSAKELSLGTDISEVFAVGKAAVNSDAATVMYIANAKTDEAAAQAARTVNPEARKRAKILIEIQDKAAKEVLNIVYDNKDIIDTNKVWKAINNTFLQPEYNAIIKMKKTEFKRRLSTVWSDLAPELRDNINKP